MTPEKLVCLAAIAGVHGVRGQVTVKTFTEEPGSVAAYGPLQDEEGNSYRLRLKGRKKGMLIAEIEGVKDRNAAEVLKGKRLYVKRDALPQPEDSEEFYFADLIGLEARDNADRLLGHVSAVYNFGAGDLLEVRDETGGERLLPFTRDVVPEIDLDQGRVLVDPPPETEAGSGQEDEEKNAPKT
ncbi:ribosome maturation factor RimM [Fodinicurvata sediminis]|uniref:ribosome maturation factor RimM n=1 Tax=Fodinicurvata sediminis TaxID=1121832 RepID=UPI0003B67172|nr:ribosome maturation factor RimM [Fodinicurvata sediminis]